MRILIILAAGLVGMPAVAQPAARGASDAPVVWGSGARIRVEAPQAAPVAAHAPYTLETPIETLMEDPVTLKWLDAHFPGLSERMRDPEVATVFAGTSIQDLSIDPDHGRGLTPEVMAKLAVSLAAAQEAPKS
jgi:hypothetical protein